VSRVEAAFWALLFMFLGSGLIMARGGTEGSWPIIAGAISYIAAAYFLFHLFVGNDRRER
jgi:hypothetical protein